jgi:tRNA (cmo5U34)-methyltransferase
MKVERFFDQISAEYTAMIARCVPRYAEMLWALFYYLPAAFRPQRILELGCGTGNLSEQIRLHFPTARLHLTDLSPEIIAQCQKRLGDHAEITYEQADFKDLRYPAGSFDLVISSISIHHLPDAEKALLFGRIFDWLQPKGIFTYSDQFRGASETLYQQHMAKWKEESRLLGSTDAEWQTWMKHQEANDYHATLVQQISWLQQAGFADIDVPWRYVLWTVMRGQKQ